MDLQDSVQGSLQNPADLHRFAKIENLGPNQSEPTTPFSPPDDVVGYFFHMNIYCSLHSMNVFSPNVSFSEVRDGDFNGVLGE